MTERIAVDVDAVFLDYGVADNRKKVFENITLAIPRGHIVAIVGRSGVGKSSLLRVIGGLVKATRGTVTVFGKEVLAPPAGLGYVVQDYSSSLFPWLSVRGNILLAMGRDSLARKEKIRKVSQLLDSVGLSGEEKSYPWQLSGGMQQRVAIARALAGQPQLLLMDEPFASVDAQVRLELEDLTRSLVKNSGITTVFVTHDLDEAVYLSDRVVVMSGAPAHIAGDVAIDLGEERNQLSTRATKEFHHYRRIIHESLNSVTSQEGNEWQ